MGPDGSPHRFTGDEAANQLRLLNYDKLGVAVVTLPTAMPQAHSKKRAAESAIVAPTAGAGVGASSSGLAAPTAEAGVVASSSGSGLALTAPATTNRAKIRHHHAAKVHNVGWRGVYVHWSDYQCDSRGAGLSEDDHAVAAQARRPALEA